MISPDDLLKEAEAALSTAGRDPDRDILVLLEFAKAVNSIADLGPLLDQALSLLVEATGAERGLILRSTESGALEVVAATFRGTAEDLACSQTIARQVLASGKPFHSDSLRTDPKAQLMESVRAQGLEWAIAVPLRHPGKVVGVFYADSRRPAPRLLPATVPFVEALAEHAAIAIERAALLEERRERERAEREALEMRRLAEQKSRFIDQLAHELSNPLTAISGYARRITAADERQEKAIRILKEESQRLMRLVSDLLDLARARGAARDTTGSFEALEVLRDVRERLPDIDASAIALPESGAILGGSRDAFHRVLVNLVSNAFRHGASHVNVRLDRAGDSAWDLLLEDDGPGIAEELLPHLFEEFWRAPSAKGSVGHGLGLSIVKGLVEAHAGAIRYEPSALGGAAFRVTWPAPA